MSDLRDLEDEFDRCVDEIDDAVYKVVAKGALNIKNDTRDTWKRELRGTHAKRLHFSVGYDITPPGGDVIAANIGPDVNKKKMQGGLGGIIEEGQGANAPVPALNPAWRKESPRFEKALGDVAERLMPGD